MKKSIDREWTITLLVVLFLILLMIISQVSRTISKKNEPRFYYSSMEKAANYYSKYETNIELKRVQGKEGCVYISLVDTASRVRGQDSRIIVINGYNFYTLETDGVLRYSVANVLGIPYLDPSSGSCSNSMNKMNTAPGSTEQLVFGTGEELARECAEKTGLEPEFIHYNYKGEQYVVWYIISPDGLDELPDTVSFGRPTISKTTAAVILVFLNAIIVLSPVMILLCKKKRRKKMLAMQAARTSKPFDKDQK